MKKKPVNTKTTKYRIILSGIAASAIAFATVGTSPASEAASVEPETEEGYVRQIADDSKKFGDYAKETTDTRLHYINFLKSKGEYRKGEQLCRPIISEYERSGRTDAYELARIEDQLGRLLRHQGVFAEAELYQRKSLAIYEKNPRYYALMISSGLVNLAKVLMDQPDKLQEAKQMLLRAIDIETKLGKNGDVSEASGVLGICLTLTGETIEARNYLLPLLTTKEKSGLPGDSYASLFGLIGNSYFHDKEYDQANKYYQLAQNHLNKVQPGHPKLAGFLTNIANIDLIQGRYEQASQNLNKAREINNSLQPDRFAKLSEKQRFEFLDFYSLVSQSKTLSSFDADLELSILKKLQQNPQADEVGILDKIYQKRKNEFGATSPLACEALLQIAVQLQCLGGEVNPLVESVDAPIAAFAAELLRSEKSYTTETKRTIKALGGRNNAVNFVTEELLLIAYLNGHNGKHELATENLKLAEQCLEAQISSKPSHRKSIVSSQVPAKKLLRLASAWLALGRYNVATKLSEKALAAELESEEDSKLKLETLIQLGNLSLAESDVESANDYAKEAERISDKLFSADSKEVTSTCKLWAQIKFAMGRYDEARNYTSRALQNKNLPVDDLALFHNIAGFTYLCSGKNQKAEAELLQSIEECERLDNQLEDRTLLTSAETALAEVYINVGAREQAFHHLDRALSLDQLNHTTEALLASARDCAGLAKLEELEGDHELATRYALRAAEKTDKFLKSGFSQLSFAQQCSFLNVTRQVRSTLLNTCSDSKNLQAAYGYIIRWEGLLLETLRSQSAITTKLENASEATKKNAAELSAVRTRIGELANGDPSTFAEVGALTAKKERLERELSQNSKYQAVTDVMADRDVEGFRKLLKPDQAFLDILTFTSVKDDSEHYALIVLKGGAQSDAKMFDLGATASTDRQIAEWRNNIAQKLPVNSREMSSSRRDLNLDSRENHSSLTSDEYLKLTNSLANLFINNEELSKFLGDDVKRFYLCAQSEMAKMPWDSLSTICGTNNPVICQIDSPREFVQMTLANEKSGALKTNLLLTGISEFHDDAFNDCREPEKRLRESSMRPMPPASHTKFF